MLIAIAAVVLAGAAVALHLTVIKSDEVCYSRSGAEVDCGAQGVLSKDEYDAACQRFQARARTWGRRAQKRLQSEQRKLDALAKQVDAAERENHANPTTETANRFEAVIEQNNAQADKLQRVDDQTRRRAAALDRKWRRTGCPGGLPDEVSGFLTL